MEEVFLNKFEDCLTFIVPCMGFILPQELEDGLISGVEFGNESTDVLQLTQESPYFFLTLGWRHLQYGFDFGWVNFYPLITY